MNRRVYNRFKPYGVSVLATAIALLITLWQKTLFAPTPALLFFIAIILSNWYGGLKSGLLAAVLSTLAINYFFIPPLFVFTLASLSEAVRLGIFILVAFIVNLLSSDLRRSKWQVEQLDRELLEVTQKSAEQLKLALTAARMGMWNWNLLTGEINWSSEHAQLFGLAPGTFDGRYETFDARLHPDDREALTIAVNRAIQERRIFQHEYRVVWTDGSMHWVEGRGQAFYDETGQAVRMTGTVMDISDRKLATNQLYKVNRALKTLSDCNQALIRATDEADLLNNICKILVTIGGYRLVWVGFAEDDTAKIVRPVAQSGYEAGYLESLNITWADTERGRSPTGTAIRTGEPCIAQNLLDNPNFALWREQAIRRGYASSIALPLIANDKPFGAITIYAAEPNAFDDAEVKLLIELAQDLAYGIVALRTQKARTLAEKALEKSEEQLSLALNAADMGMWDVNLVTNEVTWSNAHERLFGLEPGTFDGRFETFYACLHPDDHDALTQAANRAISERTDYHHEFRVVWKDGSIHWIEAKGKAFYNEAGQAVRMTGTVMDISDAYRQATQRKNAEIALQHSEERFRRAVLDSPMPIMLHAEDGEVLQINQTWTDLSGYTHAEIPTIADWTEKAYGERREQVRADIDLLYRLNERVSEGEYTITTRMGETRTWEFCSAPLGKLPDDRRLVISTALDVSDRKQAEAALQEREAILRLFAQYAPAGIAMLDRDMRYVMASQRWVDEYNLDSIESLMNRSHYEIFPEIPERWRQIHQRCLAGAIEKCDEDLFVRPDGTEQWISWEIHPWHTATGEIGGIIIFTIDVTNRKNAEAALASSERRLRTIIEAEPECVKILTADAALLDMNPAGLAMIEADNLEQVRGQNVCPIVAPANRQAFVNLTRQVARGKSGILEFEIVGLKGTRRWLESHAVPLQDESGAITEILAVTRDITQRKQAEAALQKAKEELEIKVQQRTAQLSQANELLQRKQEALQQSESTLRSFFDSASMMMGIVELMDDDILHISDNATTAKLFGLTPETMQNKRASEMGVPQEFLRMWIERYREAERTQSPVRFEYTHESDQGQRWLSATVSLIAFSPSKPQRFSYVVEDISDRKLAEEERDNLINIIEASPDFIGMGFELRANYLNRAAREWMGLSKDEDLTNFFISNSHPNWAFEIVRDEGIPAAIQHGVWLGETAFLKHDGREIPTSQLLIAHKGADGSVKMFSTIARDITQQKQVEATLREAERRWRSLLENVRLLVVGLDITGKVEFANAFFLEVTGYTQAEVLGKDWFETFLPLQEQQQVHTAFQEILEHEFHHHYTNTILTKSGEERIIAWNNTLLQNLQGEVIGTMSIGEDITQRHAVEKMKNEFVSIVSHELRTPLTSIRGSLGMLATGALNNHPERMRRMIEIAAIDTERLVRLVNDILDLERLDSGRVTLVKECCNAAALMVQAAEAMRSLAEKENITLSVSPVSTLVWASPDHIIQTLTNLLSNAIKFSPANSTITLIAEPQGDRVLFQLKDQGRGIPADKLDTIFGRFQQVDASDSRSKGGTGLGLAICHSIITQHGGRIWVESVLSEGSTFYFTLPVSPEQA